MQTVEFYVDMYVAGTSTKVGYASFKTVSTELTGSAFGDQYNYAIALRILHEYARLALNENTGLPGNISSEREGKVGITYNNNAGNSGKYAELSTTRWGLMLIDLIDSCIMTINVY